MGKFYKALEKSKKELSAVATAKKSSQKVLHPIVDSRKETRPGAGFEEKDHLTDTLPDDSLASPEKIKPIRKIRSETVQDKVDDYLKKETLSEVPKKAIKTAWVKYELDEIDPNLITFHHPQSVEAEQFKKLRSNLLFPPEGNQPPKSILVTSAIPGEGKSFISANLAVCIAQNIDDHVLLIDCDLRNPTIHSIMGYDNVPGLSEYLAKGVSLSSLLLKTAIDKLTILPGGAPPENPSELLSSEQMSLLIKEVGEKYKDRYILIDSPPANLVAETKALSKHVDGILIVVKYGSTNRKLVEDLVTNSEKVKILGVVANRFDFRKTDYYNYVKYQKRKKTYGKS